MRIIITVLIVFSSFVTNAVNAELKSTVPSEICAYMKDLDLATSGWKGLYGNSFFCTSQYRELSPSSSPTNNPNNLTFSVEGDSTTANQAKLVLNVNNRETAEKSHEELLKASEVLSLKATGEKLPKGLKNAIKIGKKAGAKVGFSYVEVVKEDWPTGKGYEVKILIK
ncbi:MAG: hypothetical protein WCQ41_10705 [Bacillota bacterium]